MPQCLTEIGCPIEDIAKDEEITEYVESFIKAKALFRSTQDPETARPIFTKLGLYDDPDLHLELESIYAKWIKLELQKERKKSRRHTPA